MEIRTDTHLTLNNNNYSIRSFKDISDYKWEKSELKESEDELENLIKNIPVGMAITTPQGEVVEANPAIIKALGYNSKEEFLKIPVSEHYYTHLDRELFVKVLSKGNVKDFKTRFKRKDGTIFWGSITSIRRTTENGKIQFLIVFDDISERKKAEEVLKENDRLKNEFVSTVAHELQTPLTSIIGFSETILKDKNMDEDTRREFLGIIYKESQRLSTFIDDILNISRIESGKNPYKLDTISIMPIIYEVVETFHIQAKEKEIKISFFPQKNLPFILGDRGAITQICINLLGNAIKFTKKGGKIKIKLAQENRFLRLDVEDNGIGIPKDDQSGIFEKFYHGQNIEPQMKGTGLGLSIVKKIVELHKGRIEILSEKNRGSLFTIFLPIFLEKDEYNEQ